MKYLTMNKNNFDQLTAEFSFNKFADIERVNGYPKFTNTLFDERYGFVYFWVKKINNTYTVVYVGKAGKLLKSRCEQHMSGYKNSTTGKNHAKKFKNGFENNAQFELYARKSDVQSLLGEQNIPMESVEELAFIQKLQPEWNSA